MINEFRDIPISEEWLIVDLINKGWSNDKKYYIKTNGNRQYLLRISDISTYNRKKEEYKIMKALDALNILMSRPVDFGVCNNGNSVYILLTWIDGNDAEMKISSLTAEEQYNLGYNVGKTLRKIHTIPAPQNQEAWAVRFNRKIDQKIKNYNTCDVKIEKADMLINYINHNRFLLEGRPQTFQHGDFHIGNMILTADNEIGIIDFNRYDYGDPGEEFNRIVWCAELSKHFASGRINGYFEGDVPEEFFRLVALYIGSNTLSSIPWAITYGKLEAKTMINQAKQVLYWYNDFESFIPNWYIPHL